MRTLVKRLQRGEEAAYRELYACVQKKLLYFVYRKTGNADDTREIVQETFERVYTKVGSLRNPDLLISWIYRIASNLSTDRLRERRHQSSRPLAEEDIAEEPRPEEIVLGQLARQHLKDALGRVHGKYREVLILHYINGRSYSDIAVILNLRPAQVRGRIYQAREALRRELAETEKNSGEKRTDENVL